MQNDQVSVIVVPCLPEKLKRLGEEEESIKLQSLAKIKSDAVLDRRLLGYEIAADLIFAVVQKHKNQSDDELTIQYIGIRLFNDMTASLRLMLCGYYQVSLAIQRDIIEMTFLLDYFACFPQKINEWKNASNHIEFRPASIRDALDKRDEVVNEKRKKRYQMFCNHASHPSYRGNKLVAPKGLGVIGPFFDEKFLLGSFEELIQNGFYAALMFTKLFSIKDLEIMKTQLDFLKQMKIWYSERFRQPMSVDLDEIGELIEILQK